MTGNPTGFWVIGKMLERVRAALGADLPAPVSPEQLERASLPPELKAMFLRDTGAAAAIEENGSYEVLRTATRQPSRIRMARTTQGDLRLVAIARNQQVVDSDPLVFVPLTAADTIEDEPGCYVTRFDGELLRADPLGYTFDCVLPWRWAEPFTTVAYPYSQEIVSANWQKPLEELGHVVDGVLGLSRGGSFSVGWITGRIEEHAAWLAVRRDSATVRLCVGGPARAVRLVEEALVDASLKHVRLKAR